MNKSQFTNVIKVIVVSLLVTIPSSPISRENILKVRNNIKIALVMARSNRGFVSTGSLDLLGFADKIFLSTGSTPSDWAGGPVEYKKEIILEDKVGC